MVSTKKRKLASDRKVRNHTLEGSPAEIKIPCKMLSSKDTVKPSYKVGKHKESQNKSPLKPNLEVTNEIGSNDGG
jgi:hypothetical protein